MRSNSVWRNHNLWVCLNHLPCVRYPAGTQACWYHGCKSVRPPEKDRPAPDVVDPIAAIAPVAPKLAPKPVKVKKPKPTRPLRARDDDSGELDVPSGEAPSASRASKVDLDDEPIILDANGVQLCAWKDCGKPARPNSKYCSRNCSNKNARWRHRPRDPEEEEEEARLAAAAAAAAGE